MRALVIDDNPGVCALIAAYCVELGLEVEQAHTVRAAQQAFARRVPDIVLLDLVLPESGGLSLCEEIRRHAPDLPVIVVSGRSVMTDRADAEEAGATDYIVKPFDKARLRHAVRRALGDFSGPNLAA